MEIIHTDKAPAAVGPYSQAVAVGGFVFTSGQLGLIPETGALAEGIEAQTEQALQNIGVVLSEAGLNYGSVVKTVCFLKDMADFSVFNKLYAQYFTGKPARSCVEVAALPKGALVEIEAIAYRE